jgi:hypothetical protein
VRRLALLLWSFPVTACGPAPLPDCASSSSGNATTLHVHTTVTSQILDPGKPGDPTWLAVRDDLCPFQRLDGARGEYTFPLHTKRWAVAVACADPTLKLPQIKVVLGEVQADGTDVTIDCPINVSELDPWAALGATLASRTSFEGTIFVGAKASDPQFVSPGVEQAFGFQARAGIWDSVVQGGDGRVTIFRGLDASLGDQLPVADPAQSGWYPIVTGADIETPRAQPAEVPAFALSFVTKDGTILPLSTARGFEGHTASGALASLDPSLVMDGDAYHLDLMMTGPYSLRAVHATSATAPTKFPDLPPALQQPTEKIGQDGGLAIAFAPLDGATRYQFLFTAPDRSVTYDASTGWIGTSTEVELPDMRYVDGWDEASWGWANIFEGQWSVAAKTDSWISTAGL